MTGRTLLAAALGVMLGATVSLDSASALSSMTRSAGTPNAPQEEARQIEVEILGMSCPFCAYGVEKKLKNLEGVADLSVELESGLGTLTLEDGADISNDRLLEAVRDAGFEVAAIRRNFESTYPDWNRDGG